MFFKYCQSIKASTNRGFTLIELMIVISIIGILAAIAIPQFTKFRSRAHNTQALSDLIVIRTDLESFRTEYQEYPH